MEDVQKMKDASCSVPLSEIYGINDTLYLTAVQAQASWSYGMDVNFLAAGTNAPGVGSAGSGIYAGRAGPIKTIMPTVPTTQQMVATVSKKTCHSSQSILNYVGNNSKAWAE